jgi:tetratricopeptide (TPR) repeat protein
LIRPDPKEASLAAQNPEPVGTLDVALSHAARLMASDPAMAAVQAQEILKAVPGHPQARLLLGAGLRAQGRLGEALAVLAPLAAEQPRAAAAHFEFGRTLGGLGRSREAAAALRRAVALNPRLTDAWRELGDQLSLLGDEAAAEKAYAKQIESSVSDPDLIAAAAAMGEGKLAVAEQTLRAYLKARPTEVTAIRMLAEVGGRLGRYEDAEALLSRCLELAPAFSAARNNLATVLYRQNRPLEALVQLEQLLARDPRHPNHRMLKAAVLGQVGEYGEAIDLYEAVLAAFPEQPKAWMSYGHALKTVGRQADSVQAYRKAIAQEPGLGEAWWSLANLKTVRFEPADLEAMETQLGRGDLSPEDRFHLHYALGKALEDAGRYGESFQHYEKGAAQRRRALAYDADETSENLRRARTLFTAEFFAKRAGVGCPAPDPIFVVGLPRSGSTLIEQILASHSQVEGTMELPDIIAIARRLGGKKSKDDASAYPEVLADLDAEALAALGQEYLDRTRVQRKLGRPFFIDKMPNNFAHVGLIHLILPAAKIIDARRHPLGCCFSGFKQHFARGQAFSYDLTDIGRYYADYVALMAHFDQALPGRVHRVIYERMVADPEGQVRRLLDYCGLPFEPSCLAFYENDRAVRTASSEQVRRPIFADAVDHWRHYEPWLDPLKAALGPVLDAYPDAPPSFTAGAAQ